MWTIAPVCGLYTSVGGRFVSLSQFAFLLDHFSPLCVLFCISLESFQPETLTLAQVTLSSVVVCTGEYNADASLHCDPAHVPGCPVGGEDESLLSGAAFCSHPYHPFAHGHNRHALLYHGNEMCKYLSVSVAFTPELRHKLSCYSTRGYFCCNWMCLCRSSTQMMPK